MSSTSKPWLWLDTWKPEEERQAGKRIWNQQIDSQLSLTCHFEWISSPSALNDSKVQSTLNVMFVLQVDANCWAVPWPCQVDFLCPSCRSYVPKATTFWGKEVWGIFSHVLWRIEKYLSPTPYFPARHSSHLPKQGDKTKQKKTWVFKGQKTHME